MASARVTFTQIVGKFRQLVRLRHNDIRYLPRKAACSVSMLLQASGIVLLISQIRTKQKSHRSVNEATSVNVQYCRCNND
jgi:hypothetical protein